MDTGGMSIADYLAVSRDNGGVFGGNGGFLWVILIFLFFLAFNGGGLFGNNATANVDNNLAQTQRDILESSCSTQKEILKTQFDTQMGFANVNQNMAQLGYQMQQCCCDLKTQLLQDKYDAVVNELNLARDVATNQTQTQNITNTILSNLGNYYQKPAVNPYTCYTGCGCSGNI